VRFDLGVVGDDGLPLTAPIEPLHLLRIERGACFAG
jgi:hypothetical protein